MAPAKLLAERLQHVLVLRRQRAAARDLLRMVFGAFAAGTWPSRKAASKQLRRALWAVLEQGEVWRVRLEGHYLLTTTFYRWSSHCRRHLPFYCRPPPGLGTFQ